MKQVLIKQGSAQVEEVPAPQLEPGTVLVRVQHSCISVGTEMVGIRSSGQPLWKRALRQPKRILQVAEMVSKHGVGGTQAIVQGKLSTGSPTGYSAAGTVLAVGAGIDDLEPGDRVACAGAQCAHHAEVIRVPRNLTVLIPENLESSIASTVTLGAIALQGVRRAQPTLGENFVVIGLGVLGQMTAQLLQANGCRVIGVDLDRARIQTALSLGMEFGVHPEDGDDISQIARLTDGIGADGVIITAATPSDAVISTAFKMCRRKGRVVLVGDVGLNLNRGDFYQKEIDFFISTSYGPGRYDMRYEEQGLEYPVAYVRWTENRNLAEYLRLIADGKLKIAPLVAATYPLEQATDAYDALKSGEQRPLMVLLSYPDAKEETPRRTIPNPAARPATPGALRLAIVGAGGFAKGTHLPNLQQLAKDYHVRAIVSRTGHNATATARTFGAAYATTDYAEALNDPEVDAVLIATRHNLHAEQALAALQAGKHVLLEKPMALTYAELEAITRFYEEAERKNGTAPPQLLTGFNRRFSPTVRRLFDLVQNRSNPMILNYRMNAGYLPLDHWTHGEEGGGRNRGEACHLYDLFTFLTNSRCVTAEARSVRPATGYYSPYDNFVATIAFEDGSVATLTYTALGAKEYPKESLEVYVDGKVFTLDDYKSLKVYGAKAKGIEGTVIEKGQKQELEAFAHSIKSGGAWAIPLWQQAQATDISLRIEKQLRPEVELAPEG